VNDHVHRAFLGGDQRYWHFECPHCQQLQRLELKQLKYDTNDVTKPGGRWNFDEMAKTLRYECVACGHKITDTAANRKHIASRGRWVKLNPSAPSNRVSFTWSALLPPWVRWRDIAEEFIASFSTLMLGDHEPYKSFVNETLGEPWEDRLKEYTDFGALENRRGDYAIGHWEKDGTYKGFEWKEEFSRLLAVDVQKDHFRYVCRAFGPLGASKLVAFGRVDTEDELDALPLKLGVKSLNVLLDSGHEAAKVYRICARNGWKAFKGMPTEYFPGVDEETEKKIRMLWALTRADPALGTPQQGKVKPIKLYLWSNPGVKDMLAEWMAGLGPEWTIANDEDANMQDYVSQVTAEKRVEKIDAKGRSFFEWIQIRRANHYWDCECMIAVAALIIGLVGQQVAVAKADTPIPETAAPAPEKAA